MKTFFKSISNSTAAQRKAFIITNIILIIVLLAMLSYTINNIERQTTMKIILPKVIEEPKPEPEKKLVKGKMKKVALKAQASKSQSTKHNNSSNSIKKPSYKKRKTSKYKFRSSSDSRFKRRLAELIKQDTIEIIEVDTTVVAYKNIPIDQTDFSKLDDFKSSSSNSKVKSKSEYSGSADKANTEDNNSFNALQFYLEGRSLVVDLPNPIYTCDVSGKVVVVIRVNKKGKVVEAEIDQYNTKTTSPCILRNAVEYAKEAIFSKSDKSLQTGTITYHFTS